MVPAGLAYAGNNQIWMCGTGVFEVVPLRCLDLTSCERIHECADTALLGGGLALDGNVLYQMKSGLVRAINPWECEVISSGIAPSPDLEATGLAWDGEYLWQVDSQTLWQFTPPPECKVVKSCPNPVGFRAQGLSFCGRFLNWRIPTNNYLVMIDPNSCQFIENCTLPEPGAVYGITSDGLSTVYIGTVTCAPGTYNCTSYIVEVEVDCSDPTSVENQSWGQLKSLYRTEDAEQKTQGGSIGP
jgi:hypothetical protein